MSTNPTGALAMEKDSEEGQDDFDGSLEEAIENFCDICERPVGSLRFTVPQTDEADRAILALFDAIGRNP